MLIIKGIEKIISKKDGKEYAKLHLIDEDIINDDKFSGQSVTQEFVDIKDCDIDGELKLGARVRIFKETDKRGFDKTTFVKVFE